MKTSMMKKINTNFYFYYVKDAYKYDKKYIQLVINILKSMHVILKCMYLKIPLILLLLQLSFESPDVVQDNNGDKTSRTMIRHKVIWSNVTSKHRA